MDWLIVTLGSATALAGLALTLWALFYDRARGRQRCPRCWYDMSGDIGLTCPECGATARGERSLLRTRRRRWWAAAGVCVILAGGIALRSPVIRRHDWTAAVPNPIWRALFPLIDPAPTTNLAAWYNQPGEPWLYAWDRLRTVHRCNAVIRAVANNPDLAPEHGPVGDDDLSDALVDALDQLPFLGHQGRIALPSIRRLLDSLPPEHRARVECIWAVDELLGPAGSTSFLVKVLRSDASAAVRLAAITALDGYPARDSRAQGPLLDAFLAALDDTDPTVRLAAARGLRDWAPRHPRVLTTLEHHAANDPDAEVRDRASEALARLRAEIGGDR